MIYVAVVQESDVPVPSASPAPDTLPKDRYVDEVSQLDRIAFVPRSGVSSLWPQESSQKSAPVPCSKIMLAVICFSPGMEW